MMQNFESDKLLEILIETEKLADQILQNKQEIIAMDKRRQDAREGLRNLMKTDDDKTWLCVGSLLMKMPKGKAIALLKKGI